jgi:hypothetical protein
MIGGRTGVPDFGVYTTTYSPSPPITKTYEPAGGGGAHTHTANAANFAGGTNSVLQPYLTLIYVIKT